MNWQYIPLMLLWSVQSSTAQECLQGGGSTGTQIPFTDLAGGDPRLPTGSQAIVTSYQFHCCGEILEWGARVQPGGDGHRIGVYTVHFQVWRPSPTSCGGSGDGNCYSLVGENRFPGLTLEAARLVRETPQPTNVISVRPRDALGYFVSSTNNGNNEGIQLDPDFTNDVVYYADFDAPLTMGTASVGPGGVLSLSTSLAPVVSVGISTSDCPPLPPIMMTSSSTRPTPQPSPTPTPPPQTTTPTPETQTPPMPTDPPTTEPIIPDPPTPADEASPEHPTTDTIIIIAPSNTQSTTDTVLGVDNGQTFLPTVIGVVVPMAILAASLLTLLVVIAIIWKKNSGKHTLGRHKDIDMQGNDAYSLRATNISSDVITDANAAYSCRGEMETSTHFLTSSHERQRDMDLTQNQAYVATNVPLEPNQCYASSADPDQLYATVEGEHNITHTSQQETAEEYDYVVP